MSSPRPLPCMLAAVFLIYVGLCAAQPANKTSAQRAEPAPQTKPAAPDYSQEALVIEQLRTSYRFEKDGTGRHEITMRVKLQSEAAVERFGQLIFPYISANEKLDIDYVRVTKSNGAIVSASAADVQDVTAPISREAPVYTDVRQKHVTVPGLRPNDLLEYHMVWTMHTPLAANHFWMNYNFIEGDIIVLDEELQVDVPADSVIKLKNAKEYEPAVKEQAGRRTYSWKHAVLKREEPKDDDKEAARKRREELEDPKPPHVQITTFKSWDEVGQWYAALARDRVVPDDGIRTKVEELLRGRNTDEEKVRTLYEFVAKNFRYVSLSLGEGRYQPRAAAEVLANQYGDCKDKHTLLTSMLTAAGLKAYPALMNSSRKLDPDVPSPGQFDHVITVIPLGREIMWADTTAEVAPFRLLAPQLRDKKALVVPTTGEARLETTPAEPPFISSEIVEVTGEVTDLGKLKGHARMTLRGDSEMEFRLAFRRTPQPQWKNLGFALVAAAGARGGEASEIKMSDLEDLGKPLEIEFDFTSDNFLDWSTKKAKLNVPLPTIGLPMVDADKDESSKPIQLGAPIIAENRLTLKLPPNYQARLPVPVKVTRDYATYSSSYKLDGATLTVERIYKLQQHELIASRTQDLIAFTSAARADEAQTVNVETESVAGTPKIPDNVKVEELVEAAEAASQNNNFPLAESLLKKVLEREPKHKTARRQLGYVLYSQQKYEEAIAVLKDQAKLNPFDDYAHNMLGRVFWAQQKYADAEASFRRQIEVTPLDKYAHGNLGLMLVEWRKYQEAVPELEQAISLNPDGENEYEISLGRAYLNLNQTEKALATFDRAVKADPGQRTWNDVAYYLALSKVQLDKAQQYAESAVTEVETDLRNTELGRLRAEDLQNVASMAACWDTLGWVYFQKGDFERAEKYVAAAWALEHHGEVGYHLGQIYEQRGNREEAARLYAQAAASTRTVPEAAESLEKLVGKDKATALLRKADDEARNSRTINLGKPTTSTKDTTEAQFFVALMPGAGGQGQVSDVRFIGGDDKLKPMASLLKTAKFNFVFPSEKATKVIRRGTLFCHGPNSECSFLMVSPEFATSID